MTRGQQCFSDRIVTDPKILGGRPAVKGTRISVELVLRQLAQDLDLQVLYTAYPRLTADDVKACLAYAEAKGIGHERTCVAAAGGFGAAAR